MEAVTDTYMQKITIIDHAVPIPMTIDIPASSDIHVTAHDVLRYIYYYLRIPLTSQEYGKINAELDAGHIGAVVRAYEARYHSVRRLERQMGLERVDMLTNQTLFMGLAPTNKPGEFIMQIGPF